MSYMRGAVRRSNSKKQNKIIMKYISTRGKDNPVSGAEAIVKGLADDGGLYVPVEFPVVSATELDRLTEMSYPERCAYILGLFFDDFSKEELLQYCEEAYTSFDGDPAPLVKLDQNLFVLELWHGPTLAFKDMALSILPKLFVGAKKKIGDNTQTLILTATSGDTGTAALNGFKDADGVKVIVLYPDEGVSPLQKLQMTTAEGNNVNVVAVKGNFDDAQRAVKNIFEDAEIRKALAKDNISLSSANSINIGRLIPQVAYYFSAYADMLSAGQIKNGDKINFIVPSGNFGNILAGYYALKMGLPIGKLICASNQNKVLTDFFNLGSYDISKRDFHKTTSPSMDILVSSNLERLIFELSNRDSKVTAQRMTDLKKNGRYTITSEEKKQTDKIFSAGWADEDEVADTIEEFFEEYGYISDPHTAVALKVWDDKVWCDKEVKDTPTVVVSTASPYKFTDTVLTALEIKPTGNVSKDCKKMEELTALPMPDTLKRLFRKKNRFDKRIEIIEVKELICSMDKD